ncbi:MAG: radical SAM protein [Gemmatimonadota bacterium]
MPNRLESTRRRLRILRKGYQTPPTPPFLILFINSLCNMKCEHCFYWRSLNGKDDLTKDEIFELSRSLGPVENLNLSGGEPFLRKEFSEICRQFIRHNGVGQIYVPTNGYFPDRIVKQVGETLEEPGLDLFVVELSLDGMPEFHDTFRVARNSFRRAMESYDALATLQESDARLRIHAISTATDVNMDEIRRLTTYLYERCPKMDHHNLAVIRGDRKNPGLEAPLQHRYEELYAYIRRLWAPREEGRYGAAVEPMLQWAKVRTMKENRQVVPCRAGRLTGVVYANGDVSLCEMHTPLGNLREQTFPEIWNSPRTDELRAHVAARRCHCTTEVFLWSSIAYNPGWAARAMVGGRVWRRPRPLDPADHVPIRIDGEGLPIEDGASAAPPEA